MNIDEKYLRLLALPADHFVTDGDDSSGERWRQRE